MAVELGEFRLVSYLARGGMGEVWRAEHRQFGTPAAVKVIRLEAARRGAILLQEVGATAALDHPNIISVLDVGEVSGATAARSGGWLEPGATWMAMEMASDGSLARGRHAPRAWSAVRGVLVALLDALAHAHARGFVHLDVKPGNVLFCSPRDARPGPKLTDFGIARALHGPADASGFIAGTPATMAPEQWGGRWHDIGPWTDLYGVGCLAWWLITGRPVFRGDDLSLLGRAHCHAPPAGFAPLGAVPAQTEAWLRWLLAKRPQDRADRAADACAALLALGDPGQGPGGRRAGPAPPRDLDDDTNDEDTNDDVQPPRDATREHHRDDNDATTLVTLPALDDAPLPPLAGAPPTRGPVQVPDDWRTTDHPRPFERMTGVALLSMRAVPVVGRERERDALWAALRRVIETQRPHAVILRGLPGYGKTRLARWLAERAHELGLVANYRGLGTNSPGATCPVGGMIYQALRGSALSGRGLRAQLEAVMGPGSEAVEPLAALLRPLVVDPSGEVAPSFTGDPREALALVQSFLQHHRKDRAALLLLDDVHLSPALFGFGAAMLGMAGTAPMLIVMTVNDAAMVDDPVLRAMVDALTTREDVTMVPVGPMPPDAWAAVADGVLHLESELRRRLCLYAAGNPQLIVQLAGDWLESGWIEASADGLFRAVRGDPPLPTDLRSIWASRLSRTLASRPEADRRALEVAAAFGYEVDAARWARSCARAGLVPAEDLLPTLERAGLIWRPAPASNRWMFVHNFVRDLLVERARSGGRWERHNEACAQTIDADWRSNVSLARALGAHLLESGAHEAAVEPLVWAAILTHRAGNVNHADGLLTFWELALNRAGIPRTDERWGKGLVLRVGLLAQRGAWTEAFALLDEVEAIGRAQGWGDPLVDALRFRSQLGGIHGQPRETTLQTAQEAVALALRVGSRNRQGMAWVSLGLAQRDYSDLASAIHAFRSALPCFEETGELDLLARTRRTLGEIYVEAGEIDEAYAHVSAALDVLAARGLRSEEGVAHQLLARIALLRGDETECERRLTRARRLLTSVGGHALVDVLEALGLLHLRQGRKEEARAHIEEALPIAMHSGQRNAELDLRAQLASIAASVPDPEAWTSSIAALQDLMGREPHSGKATSVSILSGAVAQARANGLPVETAAALTAELRRRCGLPDRDDAPAG